MVRASYSTSIPETQVKAPALVELVSRPASTPSGLSRYAETLARHLEMLDVPLSKQQTRMPHFLRPLAWLGRAAGYDLQAFFESYPLGGKHARNALIHLTSENLASVLAFQSLSPSVVTVHGFFSYWLRNDPVLRVHRHAIHRFFDSLVVLGLRRADHLICVSEYLKRMLVEQIGISPANISVIYEAVDHDTFYPSPVSDAFYARFGLSHDHRYVLYVGSEQPRKNFLTLLRAFARVRERMPDVRLIKVGRAEVETERQEAVRKIDSLGLQDSVFFIGHLTGELPDVYRLADVFVFPSRYEGFGFPPLEAMACGTPVICSNTTSLPEVVGDAAVLFDPMNKGQLVDLMEQVLIDKRLREALIHQGIQRAGSFNWNKTAQETIRVYQEFLS